MTLQKRHRHMSNSKTSSLSKRSAVEHTKIHNDNEIATDSSDSDSVKEVFNKDRCVTLEVIIRLRIQKNKWLIWKKTESNTVRIFSKSIFVKLSRHFKDLMYTTSISLILFNQSIINILKFILTMMMSTMQTENQ